MLKRIFKLFTKQLDQNELLIKNMKEHDKKKKAEQQKSKVLARKQKSRP
jgi:hypothetical protein